MPFNPTDHISVYSQPRPARIAFLVDVNNCPVELRKAILDFNSGLWGGRFNLIIPIDNGIISQGYWNLINFYDPDIVYSYVNLSEALIKKIDVEISPYHFIVHRVIREDSYKFIPSIRGDFLSVDFSVLPKGIFNPFRGKFSFLICHNHPDWEHYFFFQTNFGIYNDNRMYQPPSELERLVISENSSLDSFLEQIAEKGKGLIYPWQFTASEVPLKQFHNNKYYHRDSFTVVVGDSVWDWLYMWNKAFLTSAWKRIEINQLYIPLNIAEAEKFAPAIKKLISVHAYRNDSHPPTVIFASSDMEETKLSEIGKKLTEKIDALPHAKRISHDFDELKDLKDGAWFTPKFIQHDYVSGNKFYLKPPHPSLRGKLGTGKSMVDFMIEYHPQKFSYTNMSYWWKLPRMHSLSRCFIESGGGGRIDSNGYLSVCLENKENPELCFRIPDDRSVISLLLMQDRTPNFTDDIRYNPKPIKSIYDHIQLSDKGRYLNGFLSLVGNLFNAGSLVEHHFWRTVFENMCGVNTPNESNVLTAVRNKLDKFVPRFLTNIPPEGDEKQNYISKVVDILSHLTVRFGRHLKSPATDITFSWLLQLFEDERKAFIKIPGHEQGFEANPQINKQDLLEVLGDLTSLKILVQGIKPSCPRCGFQTWYAVDEVKAELTCNGCQFKMQIPPEIEWTYRLNSLVQDAIRHHGTFPVVWTLSQLLQNSRESFIFRPCLELREDYEGRIMAEIDIACISDGKFIIGEIKTKSSQFTSDEIQKLCDVARNALPQQVLIGAFDPPYEALRDVAREITEKLKDLRIQVRVECPSGQLNEPEYHPNF